MTTDAIVMLREDHKEIRRAFDEFSATGPNAMNEQGQLVNRIIELLTVHTYIENEVMYPRIQALVPALDQLTMEAYEEHHVADVLLEELAGMQPYDDRFRAKTTVLIENVRHHMREEEEDWFPAVREALGRKKLQEIGAEMLRARESAPRTPPGPSALKKAIDSIVS